MRHEDRISDRELVDRLFVEHHRFHETERASNQRALVEYREEILRRLSELNQLRAEVVEDRAQLVQRATYETKIEAIEKDTRQLHLELGAIREVISRQAGRQAAYAAILGVALVLVPVLIQVFFGHGT